jgi:thiol-disulfide isomerase/thioredoxin
MKRVGRLTAVGQARRWLLLVPMLAAVPMASSAFGAGGAPLSGTLKPWTGGDKPAFVLDALDGGQRGLAAERGRVVIVHFFATWCAPCRHELPALQRFAERMAGQPVTVLTISAGEEAPPVQRFVKQMKLKLPVLLDRDQTVTEGWGVKILPTTWLLDARLVPRFVIQEDYDWDGAPLDAALDRLQLDIDASKIQPLQP